MHAEQFSNEGYDDLNTVWEMSFEDLLLQKPLVDGGAVRFILQWFTADRPKWLRWRKRWCNQRFSSQKIQVAHLNTADVHDGPRVTIVRPSSTTTMLSIYAKTQPSTEHRQPSWLPTKFGPINHSTIRHTICHGWDTVVRWHDPKLVHPRSNQMSLIRIQGPTRWVWVSSCEEKVIPGLFKSYIHT